MRIGRSNLAPAPVDRTAERIGAIELVIADDDGEHERITGRLRPPHGRHGRLREIEFGFSLLTRS